jgi:hypothetical protein
MEIVQSKKSQDIIKYVRNLEIEVPEQVFVRKRERGAVQEELIKQEVEQSFLSEKSIVSFVSSVNGQSREDILNSTLIAQLAANKKHPIEKNLKAWYDKYVEVLRNIGWVIENAEINRYEVKQSLYEVENVIIDILSASFGQNYIELIKKILESLKKMSEANDNRIKVFEKNTQSMSKGCFQISLVTEENGAVSMKLGTFLITSKNKITKILFIKLKSDETKLEYASSQATLSSTIYSSAARQAVIDKLNLDMQNYVAEIEI